MGFLDDLEQEAQQRKNNEEQVKEEYASRQKRYRKDVEPAMVQIHKHLQRLIKSLSYLQKKIVTQQEISGYGQLNFTIDPQFKLELEREHWQCDIKLITTANAEKELSPEVKVDGLQQIKAVQRQLIDLHLGGNARIDKDEHGKPKSAVFQVSGTINLAVMFHTDAHEGKIIMTLKNFEGLGTVVRHYNPDQITDELLDQFSRYIVGEKNTLLREELSDEYRKQLKLKVQKEEMRRQWEQKLSEQSERERAELEKDRGMIDKLVTDTHSITTKIKKSKLLSRLANLTKSKKDDQ